MTSRISQSELPFTPREVAPPPVVVAPVVTAPVETPIVEIAKTYVPLVEAAIISSSTIPVAEVSAKTTPKMDPVNLAAAGLVMIETSHDKVATAPVPEESPTAPRGPRAKPAWAQQQNAGNAEPLQQIETRD